MFHVKHILKIIGEKIMLYHVSEMAGLKILHPHVSSHNKAYVYAIEDMVTGLLFGAKKDDFDFIILTEEDGISSVYECYPNAFKINYQGKGCSVYIVKEEGFQRGMTSWTPELVCENEVKVLKEIVIEDLYHKLLEEENAGSIRIYRYEFNDKYRKKIASHIVDRLIRFQIDLDTCMESDPRFSHYYKDIVLNLKCIMDGHFLQ